jgi:hypothetical protein
MPAETRKTIEELDSDAKWDDLIEQDTYAEVLLE